MSRPIAVVVLGVLLFGSAAPARAQSSAAFSSKENGSPISDQGSNYHYRSNIISVAPKAPGLILEVLEFADRLVLRNHTGQTVTVFGYQGEPYARVLANGTVEVNTRSPAYYLNANFYGDVNVPSSASATAKAVWSVIDRAGELEWHDHRIHWMSRFCLRRSRTRASAPRCSTGRCRSRSALKRAPCTGSCVGPRAGHQDTDRRDRDPRRDRARGARARGPRTQTKAGRWAARRRLDRRRLDRWVHVARARGVVATP